MGSYIESDKYQTWKSRLNYKKHERSHYPKGFVAEAMQILFKNSANLDDAIQFYCDTIHSYYTAGIVANNTTLENIWKFGLANKLINSFVTDHNGLFNLEKIDELYPLTSDFFTDINNIQRNGKFYPTKLRELVNRPLKREDLTPGWTAITTEFGIFSPANTSYANIVIFLLELSGKPQKEDVIENIKRFLPDHSFKVAGVKCPAKEVVQNVFAVNIGVNTALIRTGMYTPETRIGMIGTNNHFKSADEMLSEYEEILKSAA